MNEITNTPLEKGNKEHYENLVGWKTWNKGLTNQKNMEPHRYHDVAKEHECQNLGGTPVEHELEMMGWYLMNQQHTASGTIERKAQRVRKIPDSTPVEKGGKTW